MKAKKCKLIVHTRYKEIEFGVFPSISKARKYVKECITQPYTIVIIK